MKRVTTPVVFAWTLFAIAWFIPAFEHGHTLARGGILPGWEAFWIALGANSDQPWWQRVIPISTALSNGLVLVSVIVFMRRPNAKPTAWLAGSFVIGTILNSTWAWWYTDISDLRAGYWLWLASFAAMAMALFALRRRPRDVVAV